MTSFFPLLFPDSPALGDVVDALARLPSRNPVAAASVVRCLQTHFSGQSAYKSLPLSWGGVEGGASSLRGQRTDPTLTLACAGVTAGS